MEQSQTSLNIGTIGQKLESARQAKGVSVSEAGRATKILSKFIEAMEADDFGALSAPVYAKSFIKMYAQYLGLDGRPLVEEYISQHTSKSLPKLSDEVRQNLAKVDQVSAEVPSAPSGAPGGSPKKIFGDVNEAIVNMQGAARSMKIILPAAVAILLLLIVVFGVTQCSDDEAEAPAAAGGAAMAADFEPLTDGAPDVYLVKPGVVEIDPN